MQLTRRAALVAGTAFAATAATTRSALATPAWESRSGLDAAAYQAKFDQLTPLGYRPIVVDGYVAGGQTRFAGIWRQVGGAEWVARHGLDNAAYQQAFDHYTKFGGYRPRCVNVYWDNGVKYAAIWDKGSGPTWIARHGLSTAAFQSEFDNNGAAGYRLVNLGVAGTLGGPVFAGIWEQKGGASEARAAMNAAQYQAKFDAMTAQGFRPRKVCGYTGFGKQYFAAIWDKDGGPPWIARHNLSTAQFQQQFDEFTAQGYWLTDVSGYDLGGQAGFAAIWEKAP